MIDRNIEDVLLWLSCATEYEFEWDEQKAETNRKKHFVTFRTAARVFNDTSRQVFDDIRHSDALEQRYIVIGKANGLLYVVVTVRHGNSIRIISARRAVKEEREAYYYGKNDIE